MHGNRPLFARAILLAVLSLLLVSAMLPAPALSAGAGEKDSPALSAPTAVPPKPKGYGPHPAGWVDVQIPRPSYVDVAARIYYPAPYWGLNATPNTTGAPWPVIVFIPGGMDTLSYCNGIEPVHESRSIP
jgi:acetyl esterase/lipase